MKYFINLFVNTYREAEAESRDQSIAEGSFPYDGRLIIILVYSAIALSVVHYFSDPEPVLALFCEEGSSSDALRGLFSYNTDSGRLFTKLWWISTIVLFYLVIPALIVKWGFREKLKNYGASFKGVARDYPLYLLMLAFMVPVVYFASTTASFQARYPMFRPAGLQVFPVFLYWEIAYCVQFVAVEFFFRGFMVHGLKRRFGYYSVFVMTVPYCMIHFGKPFGETMAAIAAGIILGTLSLKSRSIVLGIVIHCSVAICMDFFALYRHGYF